MQVTADKAVRKFACQGPDDTWDATTTATNVARYFGSSHGNG